MSNDGGKRSVRASADSEQLGEPVAWIDIDEKGAASGLRYWSEPDNRHEVALYITQQRAAAEGEDTRRAWVGLTDEQIEAIEHSVYSRTIQKGKPMAMFIKQFAKAVEAELKEINNGSR
jgi:uncharacterized protein YuzE